MLFEGSCRECRHSVGRSMRGRGAASAMRCVQARYVCQVDEARILLLAFYIASNAAAAARQCCSKSTFPASLASRTRCGGATSGTHFGVQPPGVLPSVAGPQTQASVSQLRLLRPQGWQAELCILRADKSRDLIGAITGFEQGHSRPAWLDGYSLAVQFSRSQSWAPRPPAGISMQLQPRIHSAIQSIAVQHNRCELNPLLSQQGFGFLAWCTRTQ